MPTFNQLVRKRQKDFHHQVQLPRSPEGQEHPERQGDRPAFSPEERCLHRGAYFYPQEAQLRSA